jgi:hypothetical protein
MTPRDAVSFQPSAVSRQPSAVSFEISADGMRFTSVVFSIERLKVVRLRDFRSRAKRSWHSSSELTAVS